MNSFDPDSERETLTQALRETLGRRVVNTSLRRVARDVGMSPSGLRKFIDGGRPYNPTLQRLTTWYVEDANGADDGMSLRAASAALSLLVSNLPTAAKPDALRQLVDTLALIYGDQTPDWLRTLQATIEEV